MGAVVAVILWLLDLQLHGQSVSFCTNNVRSNPAHGKVYSILATGRWLYPGLRVPQPKHDRNDITEILLKVILTLS
jgi:hypothetical protein